MSEVQRLSFTTLPQAIIETILCLLPTEEAARTSILSREWRYKWTTIPKLKFDGSYVFKRLTKDKRPSYSRWVKFSDLERTRNEEIRCEYLYAIYQVLLLRQGPIHEFTLEIDASDTCFEIDQIILHLSRNHTIKKLSLTFYGSRLYNLPSSVFLMHHLTDLYLKNCAINHKSIFNGFGSLITSLSIKCIASSTECVLRLLSNCSSLKSLYLHIINKILGDKGPNIVDLFKCLPMIEHLTISGHFIQPLVQVSVSEELPTSLIHLKCCTIGDMRFSDGYGLPFLCELIKCSQNLKINIRCYFNCHDKFKQDSDELEECSFKWEEYSDVWLEHLNEVEIENFTNFKREFEFVEFILARSLSLKKVTLRTFGFLKYEQLKLLESLLRIPRASPMEIVVENSLKYLYNYNQITQVS